MERKPSLTEISDERAARRFPRPAYAPRQAGVFGAYTATSAIVAVAMLGGLKVDGHPAAVASTIAAGFLAPYIHYNRKERRHWAESTRIYLELLDEEDDQRTQRSKTPRRVHRQRRGGDGDREG
jgi:hypothetical protein